MNRFRCTQCGVCCRKGGPGLHTEDKERISRLGLANVVCLRPGELAFDPQTNRLAPLHEELLKIRGKDQGWECIFFDVHRACTVYQDRPLECRALHCDNTDAIFHALALPRLNRAHLVPQESALGECIAEHERLFPVRKALDLLEHRTSAATQALETLVRNEVLFRQSFADRVQVEDVDLWLYFGRPLWLVLLPLRSGSGSS